MRPPARSRSSPSATRPGPPAAELPAERRSVGGDDVEDRQSVRGQALEGHDDAVADPDRLRRAHVADQAGARHAVRSEEHTSELQSIMRTSYAVFCLTTKNKHNEQKR